jgi:hypothetical protein
MPGDERAKYGSLDNPGVSCYDLSLEHSDLKSDTIYYIDPNGGSVVDAVEVTCRQVDNVWSTCLMPEEHNMHQLWSLAVRSRSATQTVTSTCSATELMGADGKKLSDSKRMHSIIVDPVEVDCQYTISTKLPFTLPIVGWAESEEPMKTGELCYS